MTKDISRRSFLTTTLSGMGTVAFGSIPAPFISAANNNKFKNKKKLIATTDYADNIGQCIFEKKHLDDMHKYLASVGVTRHHWIYEPIWDHYGIYPDGFDLLGEAVKSAHAQGIEFYAEFKPFEGGCFGETLPHTLPFPEGVCAVKDIRGIYPVARPFTAENPHFSLKRRPGSYDVKGPVSTIRLIKSNDQPTRIKPEHLEIWISKTNNRFEEYQGPVSFRETVEWRPVYPKSKECRVLHLEGLQIPGSYRYILIRCSLAGPDGSFTNERSRIIELQGKDGAAIPFIVSTGKVNFEIHQRKYAIPLQEKINRYFRLPEVREVFHNPEKGKWHYQDFYSFDEDVRINVPYTLDREGYLAVACGKPEYMSGNLNPVYPEVRRYWLDMISHCLDKGMDGINIRTANHTRSPEDWEYGFNDPVIETAGGKKDYPTIRRINGDAYTQFLREARDLIKSRGKSISIQLYSQMLMPDDRIGRTNYIPPNFEWQWETWVKEIADELEFRGAWTLRPENLRQVVETFVHVVREAGKPFYFQGNMKEISFGGPFHFTEAELESISKNPSINGFVLYETANFIRLNKTGRMEGSPGLGNLLMRYTWEGL